MIRKQAQIQFCNQPNAKGNPCSNDVFYDNDLDDDGDEDIDEDDDDDEEDEDYYD